MYVGLIWSRFHRLTPLKYTLLVAFIYGSIHSLFLKQLIPPRSPKKCYSRCEIDTGSLFEGLHMPDIDSNKFQSSAWTVTGVVSIPSWGLPQGVEKVRLWVVCSSLKSTSTCYRIRSFFFRGIMLLNSLFFILIFEILGLFGYTFEL